MIFLFFVLGTFIGSFLNVVTQRLPSSQSLGGRSHCPACKRQLGLWDLMPVLSFIWLGGKCRTCKAPIHWRYVVMEVVSGALLAWAVWLYPPVGLLGVLYFVFFALVCFIGLITFVIDLEHYLILDKVTLLGIIFALFCVVAIDIASGQAIFAKSSMSVGAVFGAICGVVPFFLLWLVSGGRWLGFGDVKYMLFFGLTLGYPLVWVGMLFAFWLGALVSLPLLILQKKGLKSRLPFGTFLVLGQLVAFVLGAPFLDWYLGLLGA